MGRTESPSQGYRLTAASLPCPRRSFGTYGRGNRRRTSGTAVVEGFPQGHQVPACPYRSEAVSQTVQEPRAAQEVPRRQEGAFFFTKKAYCVNQTICVAESRKSVQTQPQPLSALKKPLKNNGNPRGIPSPWREARRVKACGFDPWAELSRPSCCERRFRELL